MIDQNTMELNHHMKEQEDREMAFSHFEAEMEDYIQALQNDYDKLSDPMIPAYKREGLWSDMMATAQEMRDLAEDQNGYDFTDEVDEMIKKVAKEL